MRDRFPQIAPEAYKRSVQFVDVTGEVYEGAEAVFELSQYRKNLRWTLRAYHRVPGFAPLTEFAYRRVANNRNLAAKFNNALWGLKYEPPSFFYGRWLFLRSLGLVFFVAFLSLQGQLTGLIGGWGILPAQDFLNAVEAQTGGDRFWRLPTIYWFIDASDGSMLELCSLGMALAVFATLGVATPILLVFAMLSYLSLVNIGQDFLSFQWDILLIETAFLAALYAPLQGFPRIANERAPSRAVRWLLWLLLFKLMFMSGVVKLDDPTWTQLRALDYHYETQPLPTFAAWYAHNLPAWFQKISLVIMFAIEIGVPFLIFTPRRLRHAGAIAMIFLQLMIALTGNYTFFNWLTISLCLLLFDDQFYRALMPKRVRGWLLPGEFKEPIVRPIRSVYRILFAVIIFLSATAMFHRLTPDAPIPRFAVSAYRAVAPFHIVGSYGLFARMTTTRYEIIIEGTNDGETWHTYDFKWKPGDPDERPRLVAPHQPRLDWQMWFAALSDPRRTRWFSAFVGRLLQGSPPVENLLESVPFPDAPPRSIRARFYEYHLTDPRTRELTGNWWERTPVGYYLPPVELPR